jgi:hypothetical protein
MAFESLGPAQMAAAVSTGAAGYALYRYGSHLRKLVSPSEAADAASDLAKADGMDMEGGSLAWTLLKHHPKNMDAKQVRAVLQFVSDTIHKRPIKDRTLAVS